MRICYLGENISIHNQKWIKALSLRDQIDLHVITFNRGVKFENVQYHYLKDYSGSKADYLLNIMRLRSLVKEIAPDILHAHYASSYGYMGSVCNFHPFIITGWGADIFDSTKNPLLRHMIKGALRKADAISVLSKITLTEMKKLTDKKVELIPFGVDIDKFRPSQKMYDKEVRIGTVRTLSEKYGVEYLIRAFSHLCKDYSQISLEIVGDGELKSSLEKLTMELGIRDKVKFHGYINQETDFDKYISILSYLDIFVIPSIMDSETFGVACVEASSCGIPVIASNVGGLPEVIIDGITGIIVPPKDVVQLTAAIEKLVVSMEKRNQMGEAGRRNVVENYDWNKSVAKMIDLYSRVNINGR